MMNSNEYGAEVRSASSFMYKVYAWMTGALALTAATAYAVFSNHSLFVSIMTNKILFFGLLIGQVALVMAMSFLINRINFATAALMFVTYSALLGVTLSVIFQVYTMSSIYMVFGITAGTFGVMALYGYFTKCDLTSIGNLFVMALFGMIIASFVNVFVGSSTFDLVLSFLGVLIFTGLTAYDSQRIKYMGQSLEYHDAAANKLALIGALTLYLDFINLFLYLLRLLGKRRE